MNQLAEAKEQVKNADAALSAALATARVATGRALKLELKQFIADHPVVKEVSWDTEYQSDDEGGTTTYVNVTMTTLDDRSVTVGNGEMEDDDPAFAAEQALEGFSDEYPPEAWHQLDPKYGGDDGYLDREKIDKLEV